MPAAGVVRLDLVFKVGALDEREDELGYAHLLEHCMASLPSDAHPLPLQNAETFSRRGFRSNASTGEHLTHYWVEGLSEFTLFLLDWTFEHLLSPWMDETIFESSKQAVGHELHEVLDAPWLELSEEMRRFLFQGLPLQASKRRELQSVDSATLAQLQAFRDTHYLPQNLTVVITGQVGPRMVERFRLGMSHVDQTAGYVAPQPVPGPAPLPAGPNVVFVPAKNVAGFRFVFLFRVPFTAFSPERFALDGVRELLSGSLSSRLYRVLRSDSASKAYAISSTVYLDPRMASLSSFQIHTTTTKAQARTVAALVIRALQDIRENGFTPEEADVLRNTGALTAALGKLEGTPHTFAAAYTGFVVWDQPIQSRASHARSLTHLSLAEVNAIARQIFSETSFLFYSGTEKLHF
jgi:predicted Zn-dependent peptidase